MIDTFVTVIEGIVEHHREDNVEQEGCHDTTLLCAILDEKRIRDEALIDESAYHSITERADNVNLFRTANFGKQYPETFSPNRVKGLGEIYKHNVEVLILLPTPLLDLRGEHHV